MSDESNTPRPPACTRATPRQGTSYMAYRREPLDPDDPLLGFRPVPSKDKKPRHSAITPARQRAFILALAESGIVTHAARQIGASTEALYRLRNKAGGEEFRAAWDAAIDRGIQRLEDTALARAIQGEERMVVSAGKHMGTEIRHNDSLIMFFLRNRRPARYAAQQEVGPGHPIYEKVRSAYEAEQRRILNDPVRTARIRKSIEVKLAGWRREIEAVWEAERQDRIAAAGGEIPHIDSFDEDGMPLPASFVGIEVALELEDEEQEDGEIRD